MNEPIVIVQASGIPVDQALKWFEERSEEAAKQGVTFARYSHRPGEVTTLLFEGWTERPDDQGEQRWK